MKQKDKDLLLKDLCSRLPYGVKVLCLRDFNHDWYNLEMVDIGDNEVYVTTYEPYANRYVKIEEVKPYLFPLSSMTEEQKEEFRNKFDINIDISKIFDGIDFCGSLSFRTISEIINWLNKNHFDYQGLIEKDLAIDCTNLNIY